MWRLQTELYISADTSVGRLSVPKGEFTFGKFEQPAHSQSGGSSSGGGHQPWTIGANVGTENMFMPEMRQIPRTFH